MASAAEKEPRPHYFNSWYAVTPNRLLVTLGALKGEINCDVCVVGAGFTGISAALELAQRGYSVTLLEAKTIEDSATAHNGLPLTRGYQCPPGKLIRKYGLAAARMYENFTLEGLALIVERITEHGISCNLRFGHLTAARSAADAVRMRQLIGDWAQLGHVDLKYVPKKKLAEYVESSHYVGGFFDPKGAHFHPINYTMGVLQAAQAANCKIYDDTAVKTISMGDTVRLETAEGAVNAKFVVLSGYVRMPGFSALNSRVFATSVPILATAPLDSAISHKIMPGNISVSDTSRIMNYYKLTQDNRLVFGSVGRGFELKERMKTLFPALKDAKIEHLWENHIDFTLSGMPVLGRHAANIFYAQGYCGQGVILGSLAGRLIAEAVAGTAARFDVFSGLGHVPLPFGEGFKQRLLAFRMAYDRLRDKL